MRAVKRLWERWLRIFYFGTPEIAEAGCALMAVCYGFGLLVPGDRFRQLPELFRAMSSLGPEWAWGLLFITAGAVRFGIAVDGEWNRRRTAALVMVSLWVFLGVMYAQSDPASPFLKLLVAQVASGVWVYRRLSLRNWMDEHGDPTGYEGASDGPISAR